MSILSSARKRLQQRSKLPAGDRIVQVSCEKCGTAIMCWNNDFLLHPNYPYQRLCSYCKEAEKAYNRAIFGGAFK